MSSVSAATPARVAVRALRHYWQRELFDGAAALTYYAMLALFPAVLAGVTLLGLVGGQSLVTEATDYVLSKGADQTTADAVERALEQVIEASPGALGITLVVSIALALNGASGAFAAAGRALNRIHAVEEQRGFARRKAVGVAMTLAVLLLFVVVLVAVFLGGGIVKDIAGAIGLGDGAADVWRIARWPLALAAAAVAYAVVYAYAPAIEPPQWRWFSPGAAFGVLLWLLASAGFAVYLQNFSNYGAVYGAAGAVVVLLLWLFISANAFLLGAQFDAELDREKTAGRGGPPPPSPPPSPDRPAPPP